MSEALGWQQVFIILGMIMLVLAALVWMITRDRPSDMNLPSIQEIEAVELDELAPEVKTAEKIPMGRALKMTFGAGMKFWPLVHHNISFAT
jgi:sugar phosphate permease